MFHSIDYLKSGTHIQQRAYIVLKELNIMNDLSEYLPTLCGTIPINLNVQGSDLDIIMEVYDYPDWIKRVTALYGHLDDFIHKNKVIRNTPIVKLNFYFKEFEFELFAQNQPVKRQHAYLHMITEHAILKEAPHLGEKIKSLKRSGVKTEEAFCEVLRLRGKDPYLRLLEYGREKGFINDRTTFGRKR
ncbi:DUF4269 domain-containing protein [Alteribacter aurantiacus]|uniref:DUF4269 domain-containing protein n=1 Tax=Alteribacter aurantiacus TaxID=254410 RepID=UPI000552AB92|nr:DUF4269 domain-containing protein [Alteribacter aurantiacus]